MHLAHLEVKMDARRPAGRSRGRERLAVEPGRAASVFRLRRCLGQRDRESGDRGVGVQRFAHALGSASLEDASARYGVAFLAVRRISDKFGQAKMLDFWGRVVHDDVSLETASTGALGQPWTTVKTDVAKFIRTSVA